MVSRPRQEATILNFLTNYRKYGPTPTSHDALKFAALVMMVIDHIGYLFPDNSWWRAAGTGGMAWFFFAGYARPKPLQHELIIGAVILILVDLLLYRPLFPLNNLVSIAICRYYIVWFATSCHRPADQYVHYFFLFVAMLLSQYAFEYGTLGILIALAGYWQRQKPNSNMAHTMLFVAMVVYVGMQQLSHVFSMPQFTVMAMWSIAFSACFLNFSIVPYTKLTNTVFGKIINFGARNTLYLYVIHLIILLTIAHVLYPPEAGFKWL